MNDTWIEEVAREVSRDATAVRRAVDLFDGGATVPFLLRYRREQIGPMNEAELARIRERARQRRDLEERREIVRQEIHETGAMTDELRERIAAARDRATLDDIHLAHKPRPHARAAKAVEAGLAPLADALLDQTSASDAATLAEPFVDAQKGVADADAALAGARDIIAERIHLRPALRAAVRKLYRTASRLVTRLADGIDASRATRYREVHALNEPIGHVSAHRFHLAARGAREGLLAVHLHVEREAICAACRAEAIRNVDAPYVDQIETAIEDACDRLLMPAFETATLAEAREWADGEALDIIETAFRHVLDAPPFGARRVLGVLADEKKGSRAVVVDEKGAVIAEAAFAFDGALDAAPPMEEALLPLIHDHHAQGAAIVRTASARKVAAFLHELGRMDPARRMPVLTFGEAEAGVYAAGPVAREEMPDADIPTRKAASVARRMQDPLAELLKVDPRTINLTSFHSDVDKTHLLERLERVASTYASLVGVDANAANERHLSYIAGIGPQTAAFMKKHRDEQGPFRTRSQFHQIKRMTPTAFEQCAGFLTVAGGENPLDATRIHPERYALVERMAADAKTNVAGLLTDAAARASIDPAAYLDETAGEPTIRFILGELEKPARSERPVFPEIVVDPDVHKLEDLSAGRKLTGVVTSVTDFGAFVDVGLPEEGLVHFTQLSPHRVRAPHEAVTVGMPVTAVVTDIDLERRRLSLSIRAAFPKPEGDARPRGRRRPDGPPREGERPRPEREARRPAQANGDARPRGPRREERGPGGPPRDRSESRGPGGPPRDRDESRGPGGPPRRERRPDGPPQEDRAGGPPRGRGGAPGDRRGPGGRDERRGGPGDRPRGDRPPRDRDRDRDGAPRETGRGDDLAMFGRRPERAAKGSQRDARQLGEKSSTTFKPFAGLKIVDGKIVMEPDESESGKGKK